MAKKNSRPNLAARKSASKKAEEKKLAARKAYWEAHKKQILTYAAIAVVALLVLILAIDFFYVPSGSIRTFMGNLIGVNENAIIRELDGRYYEFATVDTPDGYVPADFGVDMVSNDKETFFYYEAEEEGKAVNSLYTIGVKDFGAAEMLERISGAITYEEQTENKQTQLGGQDVHYFYSMSLQNSEVPDVYLATMTCYVDSVKDSCLLVSLSSAAGAKDTLPSEEDMLAEADEIFSCFHINK